MNHGFHAAGMGEGEGYCRHHTDDNQENLYEVGQGYAPKTAHNGINRYHHRNNDYGKLIA